MLSNVVMYVTDSTITTVFARQRAFKTNIFEHYLAVLIQLFKKVNKNGVTLLKVDLKPCNK